MPGEKEEEDEEDDTLVEELLLLLLVMAAMVEVVEVEGGPRWHSNEDLLHRPCRHCTKGSPLPWQHLLCHPKFSKKSIF